MRLAYLDAHQNGMCLACYAHDHRTLLDCLGGILDLKYPTLRRAVEKKVVLASYLQTLATW